jgi:AcrR family transcriptional regulator
MTQFVKVVLSLDSATLTKVGEEVKRRYDGSRREELTNATRARVVAAAGRLFVARGYASTTVDSIGEASDTPIATVYRLFGSKRAILEAVMDVSFVGDDGPLALHERETAIAASEETDPRRMLAGYARLAREVLDRSGPLQQVLRSAAHVDPEAAELLEQVNRQRLDGQASVARRLADRGALADGLAESEATDVIYGLMSPQLHRVLTIERGWTADRYERWLADTLVVSLLPSVPRRRRPRT